MAVARILVLVGLIIFAVGLLLVRLDRMTKVTRTQAIVLIGMGLGMVGLLLVVFFG